MWNHALYIAQLRYLSRLSADYSNFYIDLMRLFRANDSAGLDINRQKLINHYILIGRRKYTQITYLVGLKSPT